jgi:hypothetical protein
MVKKRIDKVEDTLSKMIQHSGSSKDYGHTQRQKILG